GLNGRPWDYYDFSHLFWLRWTRGFSLKPAGYAEIVCGQRSNQRL
ncbi:MAG: hypothetical protein ACI9OF_001604, partial [Saprospiraceae bacterium]